VIEGTHVAQIAEEMAVVPADSAVAMVAVMVVDTVVDTVVAPIMAVQTGSQVQVLVTGARSKPGQRFQSADPLGIVRSQIAPRSIAPLETVLSGIVRPLAIVVQRFRLVTAVPLGRKQVGPSLVLPVRTVPRRHAPMSFGELAQPDRLLAGGLSGVGKARVQIGSVLCGHRMS
jgi:hypothetical protein